ncbi:thioredoxin O2, mitochondrial-like isoform X1 [Cucurbita maxima]|uniref:Thioredoxin O2, mitochondrial-like isoform X1 n=1 Tax=Cucurbita maxima TaxID=3661 RepID=A0A6J1IR89_CUCMA|nr:thioredoxin O2, mitochondrial-like isoform X1 [Cucurbita maxima]XP_022978795.1 thioredoxin O2, mitochondrial-like isoform X1 [Cucurbita maxima]
MGTNIIAQWRLLRRALDHGRWLGPCYRNYSIFSRSEILLGSSSSSSFSAAPSHRSAPDFQSPTLPFQHCRPLCSASDPSNIIMIKSEDQFKKSLGKAQDEAFPAIFYFTAAWCGPCRLLSPVIKELSKNHPQVTTYKIDIDQEGLERALNDLNITSVPTLHFFQSGKKAGEIIGADVAGIKNIMEKLYK